MVYRADWGPLARSMAILADIGRCDVARSLSGSAASIVAAGAIAGNARVIEGCPGPRRGLVAVPAIAVGDDVGGAFAGCARSVVTTGAASGDTAVVEPDRSPVAGGVAVIAVLRRGDMTCRLSERLNPVMAGLATASHIGMIEPRDLPLLRGVAVIAGVLRTNMPGRLADCAYRIVAIGADLGRSGKFGASVARGALNGCVRSGEWKSGLEVVEVRTWLFVTRECSRHCKKQRRHKQHELQQPMQRNDHDPPFQVADDAKRSRRNRQGLSRSNPKRGGNTSGIQTGTA